MLADFKADDEPGRRRALLNYAVLDTADEPAFDRVVAMVEHLMKVPVCAVSLVDADRQWFKARRGTELRGSPRSIAFCDHTIRTAEPMVIRDASADVRFATNPLVTDAPKIRAYIGAPLVTPDGYAVGSICAIDVKPRNFTASDAMTMASFADIVVTELELRMRAALEPLSGLMTRRAFMDRTNTILRAGDEGPGEFFGVMIDLDYFKAINDRFGHDRGDDVIRRTGAVLADMVRADEAVGRIGGEEFAMMMRCVDADEAWARCEDIRIAIAQRVKLADMADPVTASIGFARVFSGQRAVDDVLRRADLGLYCAKTSGRNRVATIESMMPPIAMAG